MKMYIAHYYIKTNFKPHYESFFHNGIKYYVEKIGDKEETEDDYDCDDDYINEKIEAVEILINKPDYDKLLDKINLEDITVNQMIHYKIYPNDYCKVIYDSLTEESKNNFDFCLYLYKKLNYSYSTSINSLCLFNKFNLYNDKKRIFYISSNTINKEEFIKIFSKLGDLKYDSKFLLKMFNHIKWYGNFLINLDELSLPELKKQIILSRSEDNCQNSNYAYIKEIRRVLKTKFNYYTLINKVEQKEYITKKINKI